VTLALALLVLASTSGLFGQQIPARPAAPPAPGMPGAPGTGTQPNSQPAGKATGLIIGKVVDADSGRPVDGAVVTLGGQGRGVPVGAGPVPVQVLPGQVEPPAPPPQIFTDGQGRFLFRGLTKGSYTIGVRASGFLNGSYGQRRVNGPQSQLQLDEDERKTDVTIKLWRYASISGSVRDETGDPAVGVQVTLVRLTTTNGRRSMSQNQGVTTDDRGMYRLGNLTPGTYTVMIRSTMTSVPLSTVDELQKALSNAEDRQTRQKTMQDLSMAGIGVGGPGVQVGDQQLQFQGMNSRSLASPMPGADGRMSVYPTTFYANAVASSQATTFTVASGEERSGIDLQLRLSPAFRVSGTVLGPDGPMGNFPIKLVPGGNEDFTTDSGFETSVTTTDPFGNFTLIGVPTGQYTLTALRVPRPVPPPPPPPPPPGARGGAPFVVRPPEPPQTPTDPTYWAQMPVSVGDSDVPGVSVVLAVGLRVRGRVDFQGSSPRPEAARLQQMTINLNPADGRFVNGGYSPSRPTADGTFATVGYPPGRYYISMGSPGTPWWLRSIMVGGRESIDTPIDLRSSDAAGVVITFTDQTNELTGTVQKPANPEDAVMVVILPGDYQRALESGESPRRIRTMNAGANGQFTMRNLIPGEYLVAAVTLETNLDFADTQLIGSIARAGQRVTVVDGGKQSVTLTPVAIK
jgi:hypothetical protein